MRKKFVFCIVIPAIIFLVIVYLFIDSWITSGLEYAGEKAIGAKVEIDHLHVTINPIGIEFARLQVTNPDSGWKNLFETGNVKFALNFGQLLRGKYIIETMEVNNLILGTKRTTDGSIPKQKEENAPSQQITFDSTGKPVPILPPLTKQAKSALDPQDSKTSASFDIDKIKRDLNIDSLLNPNNLTMYRRVDTLKKQINDASVQWQTSLDEIDKSKSKLADIEFKTKLIDIGKINNIQSANEALTNAKSILNTANEVKESFNIRKAVLTDGVDKFSGSIKDLDNLAAQDFHNIVSMAHLPDVSMKGIAEMVLGKDLLRKAYTYLGYVEMARTKIQNSSDKPPLETPKRLKGQNIHFPVERAYPKFWVKKILISGGTDQTNDPQYFYVKGQALNISSDQRVTGMPLTVGLMATKGGTTSLSLDASFDRRKEPAVDNYKAVLTGLKVNEMSFGQSDFMPSKVTNAIADASISVIVPGNHFDSNTNIAFNNLSLSFDRDPNSLVERIVHDVLASMKGFHVNLRMWRNESKFDVAFTTDFDDQLASRTKQVIGDEVARIQNDLRNKLNAKISEKRQEVEKLFADKKDMVTNRLKVYESQMNDKLAMAEAKKKEIENRIDQEKKKQTDDLTKKGKDALKGLFK
jgi:uncharacterized protein (TIGR03545 family)